MRGRAESKMRRVGFLLYFILAWVLNLADSATDQSDVTSLNTLYTSLNSASQLNGWIASGGDPCGQAWKGITCSGSRVTEVKLSGLGLTGQLGYALDKLTSVTNFDLSNNNIGVGNQMPYQLPPNVTRLDLSGNAFSGGLPYSISQMPSLSYLNVSQNQLQGALNDMFHNLPSLSTIDLSHNNLSGGLPASFSTLSSLASLYMQNNQFTGTIDVLANLPLENLNIADNHFTGWIPERLKGINNIKSDGNSLNSGPAPPAPPPPPYTPPPGRKTNPGKTPFTNKSSSNVEKEKSGISGGPIAGIIISMVVVTAILVFFLIRKRQKKSSDKDKYNQGQHITLVSTKETNEHKSVQVTDETKAMQPPVPINLKNPPLDRNKSFDDNDDTLNKPIVTKTTKAPINTTMYSIADLQMATGSFSVENIVGEGFIGRVYRAQFDDDKVLAVKKINSSTLPSQASEAFMDMVSNISRLHHPNISQLVGYCSEHGQHLLVYEFHKYGSLHDFLHISDEYSKPLTWNTRVMIALGTARALEYLHEVCSPSLVHKNFTSSNIILDTELNPHLSNCGLSDLVPNAEYQAFNLDIGSGYTAPEVTMSGQYTLKSDVYSFGIVMLELLTGRKPFDSLRPRPEQSLVRWATPQLHDIDALDKMVDPALKGLYPAKSLSRFADVIALCVQSEPEFRPPMSEVVQALVRLVQRANMSKRIGSIDKKESSRHGDDADIQDMF